MQAIKTQARVCAAPSRRASVVVRASAEQVDRRAALSLGFAAIGSLFVAQEASARVLPWQESTGGLRIGKGSMTKSASLASSEGYSLEGYPGTKKPSFVEPKKKKALLAKRRALEEAKANQ